MAWFRTDRGCQYKAFSCDRGETWTNAVIAPEFKSPAAPLSMKKCPDGKLVAVWCDHDTRWGIAPADGSWRRTPLVMAFSDDLGLTWENHVALETAPNHGYCYIGMYFTADALLLSYCCGGGERGVLQDTCIRRISLTKRL